MANPLTAHYNVPHGEAIALMLPHVIRYNGAVHKDWYCELLAYVSGRNGAPPVSSGADGLADFISQMSATAGLPAQLSARGIDEAKLPTLAEDAAKQWTGTFNPRKVGAAELLELYRAAY